MRIQQFNDNRQLQISNKENKHKFSNAWETPGGLKKSYAIKLDDLIWTGYDVYPFY